MNPIKRVNKKLLFGMVISVIFLFILFSVTQSIPAEPQMKGIVVSVPNVSSDTPYDINLWRSHHSKILQIAGSKAKIALEYPQEAFAIIDIPVEEYNKKVESLRKAGYYVRDEMIFRVNLAESVPAIKGPYTWTDESGTHTLTGANRVVAVLDTGIDCNHGDFNDCNMDGAGKIQSWYDAVDGTTTPSDPHGHGTHVASIIAGTGAESGGSHKGVAPGASLRVVRVCDADGFCLERYVIQGLDWVINNRDGIDAVSMSIGYRDPTAGICTGVEGSQRIQIYDRIQSLIAGYKIPVIASAGKEGVRPGSISFPACISNVIAVGETYKNRKYYYWSTSDVESAGSGTVHVIVEVNGATYMDTEWEAQDLFGTGYQFTIFESLPVTVRVKIEGKWKYQCPIYYDGWDPGGWEKGDAFWEWGPTTFNSGPYVGVEIGVRPIYETWLIVCWQLHWDPPNAARTIYVNFFQSNDYLKDRVVVFRSGRGPAPQGTQKPDVVAPGHDIIAAKSGGGYTAISGSSQATAHVAGLVALLKEWRPSADYSSIVNAIRSADHILTHLSNPNDLEGYGRINIVNAVNALTTGDGRGGPPAHLCPTLFVWNGSEYVEETLLKIHDDANNNSDLTIQHEIEQKLVPDKVFYPLQLRELDEFISHIDYVRLYVLDSNGKRYESNLVQAIHSKLGDVKETLLRDDEIRVDLYPSQMIDLKFNIPKIKNVKSFMFEINGYNMKCARCDM